MINKAFIFDRDGIINRELGDYVVCLNDFCWTESIFEFALSLQIRGYLLFIITNQGGVAKGIVDVDTIQSIHLKMLDRFAEEGVIIQELLVCYHHPLVSKCLCRKPESLFFERCLAKYQCIPNLSWMIGDRERDLLPAKKLGMRTILIGDEPVPSADYYFTSINNALKNMDVIG